MRVEGAGAAALGASERVAPGHMPERQFAATLAQALSAPRMQLAELREAIAAICDGRAWSGGDGDAAGGARTVLSEAGGDYREQALSSPAVVGGAGDPFG